MRIFDTFRFNIADRVTFAGAAAHLDRMLAETGLAAPKTAFSVYAVTPDAQKKAAERFPALAKYAQSADMKYGLCSTTDWQRGAVFADPADRADILALFSKIPRTVNFPFCTLVLGGIPWFADSRGDAVPDTASPRTDFDRLLAPERVKCNAVTLHRSWDDGKKRVTVSVCIEATAPTETDAPRATAPLIERLQPSLGAPYHQKRECIFSAEEKAALNALHEKHRPQLWAISDSDLPAPVREPRTPGAEQFAKTALLDKIFRGTGFAKQKGNPTWLSCYTCNDAHGFRYEAYVQRLSSGGFRLWLTVSGCNFSLSPQRGAGLDYRVSDADTACGILEAFAAHCVRIRDTYAPSLSADFGDTPAYFAVSPMDLQWGRCPQTPT